MKIVINSCYGGFGLSEKAAALVKARGGPTEESSDVEYRAHPILVAVVEELGDAASGRYGELTVVDVPDDVEVEISQYDGLEEVEEVHRRWS